MQHSIYISSICILCKENGLPRFASLDPSQALWIPLLTPNLLRATEGVGTFSFKDQQEGATPGLNCLPYRHGLECFQRISPEILTYFIDSGRNTRVLYRFVNNNLFKHGHFHGS